MELNIIKAYASLDGHRALYERLRENNVENSRHIFIVPDRFTLGVERELISTVFSQRGGMYNVDVFSFSRLAVKALGKKTNFLSKEGTVLLLNRVLRRLSNSLAYYKDIKSYSFSKDLFASIALFRSSRISPDAIRQKAQNMPAGGLKNKLTDIATLYEAYEKELENEYSDTLTRLDTLTNAAPTVDFLTQSHIYILGFNVYSEQQMRLIETLITVCPSVNLSVTVGAKKSNAHLFFTEQALVLADFAKNKGARTTVKAADEKRLVQPFKHVYENMFGEYSKSADFSEDERSRLKIFCENNPHDEISAAAREINHLVKKEGFRYKDIAVVCDNDAYPGVISRTFSRFNIPYFIDEAYLISDGLIYRFLFDTLDCAQFNKNNVKLTRLKNNPLTLDAELDKLIALVPKEASVSDFCLACESVVNAAKKEVLDAYLESEDARKRASASDKLLSVIEEAKRLCGGETMPLGEFINMLKAACSDMKISLLPDRIDTVFVGSTDASRFNNVKAIFILGASGGFFPKYTGDGVILSLTDYEGLRLCGLRLFPSAFDNNALALHSVLDVFTKAENIYLGYSQFDASGEKLNADETVIEASHLVGISPKELSEYREFNEIEALEYRLATRENALYEYKRGTIPIKFQADVRAFLGLTELEDEVSTEKPHRSGGEYFTSVTRLERFFTCPFSHFLSHVLCLKEKDEGTLSGADIGSIIHAVLEKYFTEYMKSPKDAKAKTESIIDGVLTKKDYEKYRSDAVQAYVLDNLRPECERILHALTDNVENSKFKPKYVEYRFGENRELAVETEECTVILRGTADRVDVYGDYAVVFDYKTGGVDDHLKFLYYGKKIQLYLYMNYFRSLGLKSAGCLYIPLKAGFVRGGRSYAASGQILDDIDIFCALDSRLLTCVDKSSSLTADFKVERKEGKISFPARYNGNRLKEDEFNLACDYTLSLIRENAKDFVSGYAERSPLKGACERCVYKKMCGDVEARSDRAVKFIK